MALADTLTHFSASELLFYFILFEGDASKECRNLFLGNYSWEDFCKALFSFSFCPHLHSLCFCQLPIRGAESSSLAPSDSIAHTQVCLPST